VKIGQFCQFEDVLGTVERIGLRSTRIRRWGGQLLSIPNAQFAEHQLDNYNDARYIWIRQKLRLRYDTSPDQIMYLLAKIREMLFAHSKILAPRARLGEPAGAEPQDLPRLPREHVRVQPQRPRPARHPRQLAHALGDGLVGGAVFALLYNTLQAVFGRPAGA